MLYSTSLSFDVKNNGRLKQSFPYEIINRYIPYFKIFIIYLVNYWRKFLSYDFSNRECFKVIIYDGACAAFTFGFEGEKYLVKQS